MRLCTDGEAFRLAYSLHSAAYLYLDDSLLDREESAVGIGGNRVGIVKGARDLLNEKYRVAFLRKERLSATDNDHPDVVELLARRKKVGLELQDQPMALAFKYYEEWHRKGVPVDADLKAAYTSGFNAESGKGQSLLDSPSLEQRDLRLEAAMLAGIMKRNFEGDSQAARRYMEMAAFGLSHVLAMAVARDEVLFRLVCNLREGRFNVVDQERLDRDLAGLDNVSRSAVLRYVKQLDSEYVVRYIQPALNGR